MTGKVNGNLLPIQLLSERDLSPWMQSLVPTENIPVRHWAGGTCGNVLIALKYLGWSAQPVRPFGRRQGYGAAS